MDMENEITTKETSSIEMPLYMENSKLTEYNDENEDTKENNYRKEALDYTKNKTNPEIKISQSNTEGDSNVNIIESTNNDSTTEEMINTEISEKKETTEEPVQAEYEPEAEIAKMKDYSPSRNTPVNIRQPFISSSAYSSQHTSLAITCILALSRVFIL